MSHPATIARLLRKRARNGHWIPVAGTSMGPGLVEPARVEVVWDRRPPRNGQVWAFVDLQGDVVVHRFLWRRPGGYVFAGDANRRPDPLVTSDRLIGRVRQVEFEGRRRRPVASRATVMVVRWAARGARRRARGRRRGANRP